MSNQEPGAVERRQFSRVAMGGSAELHQGGVTWQVEQRYLSLDGFAVTLPGEWDADYSHPFEVKLSLQSDLDFEAYAHLMHVQHDNLGFQFEHLDPQQVEQLRAALAPHVDEDTLTGELSALENRAAD